MRYMLACSAVFFLVATQAQAIDYHRTQARRAPAIEKEYRNQTDSVARAQNAEKARAEEEVEDAEDTAENPATVGGHGTHAVTASPAPAVGPVVEVLQSTCSRANEAADLNECLNGLQAIMADIRGRETARNSRSVCNAESLTNYKVRQLFLAWAKNHPEFGQMQAALGVETALSETYPCAAGNVIILDPNKGLKYPRGADVNAPAVDPSMMRPGGY